MKRLPASEKQTTKQLNIPFGTLEKNKNYTDAWFSVVLDRESLISVAIMSSVSLEYIGSQGKTTSVEESLFSVDDGYNNFHKFLVVRERPEKKNFFHFALTLAPDMNINLNRQSDEKVSTFLSRLKKSILKLYGKKYKAATRRHKKEGLRCPGSEVVSMHRKLI